MIKKLSKSKIEIELFVPWDQWKKYLEDAVKEVSQELKIPGFRPGKAPRNLVEQKVGLGVLLNNAAEKAVQKSYRDFVLAEKLDVIGSPEVEIEEIAEGKDLKYKAKVAIMPEVKVREDYKKEIKKVNEEFAKKSPVASDEEVNLELEKIANSRVKLVTVRRDARKGDSVEIDFTVLVNNVPIENGTSKNHQVILGRGVFIPGFEDNVIGMKEGEEKEFELEFPKEYHKKDLAGRKATFKVKLNLVQERQTPEINDDFAKSLGKFENLEALKKNVKEGLEHEMKHKIEDEKRSAYIEKIVAATEAEVPDLLVKDEIERMFAEFGYQLESMGLKLDEYLAQLKKDKKELEKDWGPQAEKRVKSLLAFKEIIKMENIKTESEEIEKEMNKTMQHYKNVKDLEKNIDMKQLYNYSKEILENQKIFELLEKI